VVKKELVQRHIRRMRSKTKENEQVGGKKMCHKKQVSLSSLFLAPLTFEMEGSENCALALKVPHMGDLGRRYN
jgi:delta 1-pyrroline-5-carboxylate dehydrogenase